MAGTTNIALTKGEYIDLGAAPALVQALGGTVSLILADAVPDNDAVGLTLQQNQFYGFLQADASSHVWGKPLSGLSVTVTPILASGGGGGGGGAVTVADGADVAEGATNATAYADGTGAAAGTVVGILKGLFVRLGVLPAARGQSNKAGSLSVTLASDQGALSVTPTVDSFGSSATITRPANTTAYVAGAVVGSALSFTAAAPSAGGQVMITSSLFNINDSAVISGEGAYALALYSVTPPSAYADGTVWDLPTGDRASYLGTLQLGTPADVGSTLTVASDIINKQITAAGGSLFGYLITLGAYTPTASRVYVPSIHTIAV